MTNTYFKDYYKIRHFETTKSIAKAILAGVVSGLILLTLMISIFNYKSLDNIPQPPKPTQKLQNEIDINTFNTMLHTADNLDKPIDDVTINDISKF